MNRVFLLAFVAVSAAVAATAGAGDPQLLPMEQARSLGVVTGALGPSRSATLEGLAAQVTVPNNRLYAVSAPLAGLVEHVAVAPGDAVRRGQALARLASPDLAEVQRGLLQADAQDRLAAENLERDRKLLAEGIVPQSRVAASLSQAREARAALSGRKQALRLAGVDDATIARMLSGGAVAPVVTVTAPIDGVVLEQSVVAGQRVEPAALLFRIARTDQLALEIRAPSERVAAIAPGDEVDVDGRAQAKVVAIGAGVSPDNQTVLIRATVTRGAQALRVGEFVQVTLRHVGGRGGEGFSVPGGAVVRAGGHAYVFVETEQGMRPEPVTVVSAGATLSLVTGTALRPGMRVAVEGTAALKAALLSGAAK